MSSHYLSFLIAAVLSFFITPLIIRYLARHKMAIAIPRARDIHTLPTPRLGGLGVAISFWAVVAVMILTNPDQLRFVPQTVWGIDRNLFGVLLGSFILVLIGVVDDLRGVKPGWKLFWQTVAASMIPIFGVRIQHFANPFGGLNIELSPLVDGVLAILWIILLVNVLNFLDGLDGLATGVSSVALVILYLLALAPFVNQPALALLLLVLLGAGLGFLPYNWYPAKIFLGDSGSQLFGYLLGVAAIVSGGKVATAALVLSLPILDALWTILRRIMAGRSPFKADRLHLHHRLLDRGLNQPTIVILFMTIAAVFGMIALESRTAGKVQSFVIAAGLMALLIVVLAIWERRTKVRHEEGK